MSSSSLPSPASSSSSKPAASSESSFSSFPPNPTFNNLSCTTVVDSIFRTSAALLASEISEAEAEAEAGAGTMAAASKAEVVTELFSIAVRPQLKHAHKDVWNYMQNSPGMRGGVFGWEVKGTGGEKKAGGELERLFWLLDWDSHAAHLSFRTSSSFPPFQSKVRETFAAGPPTIINILPKPSLYSPTSTSHHLAPGKVVEILSYTAEEGGEREGKRVRVTEAVRERLEALKTKGAGCEAWTSGHVLPGAVRNGQQLPDGARENGVMVMTVWAELKQAEEAALEGVVKGALNGVEREEVSVVRCVLEGEIQAK